MTLCPDVTLDSSSSCKSDLESVGTTSDRRPQTLSSLHPNSYTLNYSLNLCFLNEPLSFRSLQWKQVLEIITFFTLKHGSCKNGSLKGPNMLFCGSVWLCADMLL